MINLSQTNNYFPSETTKNKIAYNRPNNQLRCFIKVPVPQTSRLLLLRLRMKGIDFFKISFSIFLSNLDTFSPLRISSKSTEKSQFHFFAIMIVEQHEHDDHQQGIIPKRYKVSGSFYQTTKDFQGRSPDDPKRRFLAILDGAKQYLAA